MKEMESCSFRNLVVLLTLSLVLALSASSLFAAADSYPSKPVRLLMRQAPGGSGDIIARLITDKLAERLGKPVVMEYVPGGGGVIATEKLANAAPDGYTLLSSGSSHTVQAAVEKLPYDAVKSFTPIARTNSQSLPLIIIPSLPAHSLKELIALAKQKPGQLIFATAGIGSQSHLLAELLKMMAGIDFKIVHFKGAGPGVIDMLGGHSHMSINAPPAFLPHIQSGKLRVLAASGLKRSAILPDVPTIEEAGLPGYNTVGWNGILAPAGVPAPIVNRLSEELKVILASNEIKKRFLDQGVEPDYQGPTEFGAFIEQEVTSYNGIVKKAGIKLE